MSVTHKRNEGLREALLLVGASPNDDDIRSMWIEVGRRPKLQIRLKASMAAEKDAYQITYYPRRSCGAGTLPKKLRDDFPPGTHVLAFAWNDGVWFTLEKKGDPHA